MDAAKLRVVFVGMSRFYTRPILRAVAGRCSLAGVVECAANDADRRTLMEQFARHRRLPYFMLRRTGERAAGFIEQLHPDVICVAGCAMLLRKEEFGIAPLGAINVHPSLLPKFRGPDPYFWQYHEMDLEGGVSVHQVDETFDTGDIFLQERYAIGLGESFVSVFQRSVALGARVMVRVLENLARGQATPCAQRGLEGPLYARRVAAQERLVDWGNWPIERVWHFLRGTHHQHCSFTPPFGAAAEWAIGAMEGGGPCGRGEAAKDASGYYLAHGEGRIRLIHRGGNWLGRAVMPAARRVRRVVEWW